MGRFAVFLAGWHSVFPLSSFVAFLILSPVLVCTLLCFPADGVNICIGRIRSIMYKQFGETYSALLPHPTFPKHAHTDCV